MNVFWSVLHLVLFVFMVLLWIRMISDWVRIYARRWRPTGVAAIGLETVYSATDPAVKLVRRVIPPVAFGGVRLDLGFMVLLLVIYVVLRFLPVG